jgi:divalent anion:Na+ symporter, DASS family
MVPSNNARVVLVKPILTEMTGLLGFAPRGRAATGLAISAFTGVNLLTSVFLSAKSANFVIQGLLSPQGRLQFQWLSWLAAASVTGALMLAFHLVGAALLLRSPERSRLERRQVAAQVERLGPLKPSEWAAIAGSGVFAVGVVTASVSKVHPPWLALAILYGLLLLKFIDKAQFRERIDWPFLIHLGCMVGIIKAFNHLGFGALLASHLSWLGEAMRTGLPGFILLLCGLIFVLRLVMPTSATAAIAATVFMPLAAVNGINPWVIGFIILVVSEMWLLPYQCSYYAQFRETAQGEPTYSEARFLAYNLLMNGAKLVAIHASLPYWRGLGLI